MIPGACMKNVRSEQVNSKIGVYITVEAFMEGLAFEGIIKRGRTLSGRIGDANFD